MFRNLGIEESKKLYRKLAMRLHPDYGGSNELMKILIESYDEHLKTLVQAEKEEDDPLNAWLQKSNEEEELFEQSGIFEYVSYDILEGDKRLIIFDAIKSYAAEHQKFDLRYTESIEEFLESNSFVTEKQFNSLVRIFHAFRMQKYMKR